MARRSSESDKDRSNALNVTGRFQSISTRPADEFRRCTLAAGAVLWRGDPAEPDTVEVALIHRPRYDDWSLAKGKVDPGESLPQTAAREILEETGHEVRLGKLLGRVTYPVADRTKVVYYFTAKVTGGEFTANDEVDEIRWLPFTDARGLLSYDVDRQVLDKAAKRLAVPVGTRLLLVRHAHAFARHTWSGNDDVRPLDKKGRRQATALTDLLAPYRPDRIYSAKPDRCVATAEPLAARLGLGIESDVLLGDEGWTSAMKESKKRYRGIIADGGTPVVVSQGLTIPDVIAWLSAEGRLPLHEPEAKKASVWVLTFTTDGELTGADYLASPLPVK
ncbi:NUDIX hydrolase [Corynebacterium pygosceleis]|uniref:NUDIX hydrolase n=1 Tax=Corynebacterium pygosceleis TaxID=2800406 RepID=A0ABT3WR96_9CORY|nr:NUDIX hydrolase [Corynebacterium pygosceleis]MCK7675538.1 NUDIX hydrolase [Corynebacterium pygosceleis]MCX7444636.1 NUDIX hydrolase [Corynebacterium pygosceleis]